jgi:2,5-diketo-D-gluconate reductase A
VANFQVEHLTRLAAETETVPAVNQIEIHPFLLNQEVRAYGAEHGIVTEAWSPLGRGAVVGDLTIGAIADELGRTPVQVILRWHIQLGNIVLPKSATPARIRENFEIFDFELTPEAAAAITTLDRGESGRTGPHPDTFDTITD